MAGPSRIVRIFIRGFTVVFAVVFLGIYVWRAQRAGGKDDSKVFSSSKNSRQLGVPADQFFLVHDTPAPAAPPPVAAAPGSREEMIPALRFLHIDPSREVMWGGSKSGRLVTETPELFLMRWGIVPESWLHTVSPPPLRASAPSEATGDSSSAP